MSVFSLGAVLCVALAQLAEGFVPFTTNFPRWYSASDVVHPMSSNGARVRCPLSRRCRVVVWGDPTSGGSSLPSDLIAPAKGKGVVSITSNLNAFAALKEDGSVTAWGDENGGGSLDLEDLTDPAVGKGVVSIAATTVAFAALKEDGSVSAWGAAGFGGSDAPGDVTAPDPGKRVTLIAATAFAFAALKEDGSVSVWGDENKGGSGAPTGQGVVSIFSNNNAFVALKGDGSVVSWGDNLYGGGVDAPGPFNEIASNTRGFAALNSGGSIISRGNGVGSAPAGVFKSVTGSSVGFAALKEDGSVISWGNSVDGGTGLTEVVSITTNQFAFAALKQDGSVVAWGGNPTGHGGGTAPSVGKGFVSIASTLQAFAALREDGSVVAWGDAGYGNTGIPEDLSSPEEGEGVAAVASTRQAFAAVKQDGSVSAWGDENYGGANVPAAIANPAFGVAAVGIASTSYAFAALVTIPLPSDADAKYHVVQENDDHLALRVDDEHDDTNYFFVDHEGRVRVNSNVYDEAAETLVVDGSSRFRGDVFLNYDNVPLAKKMDGKLSCSQSGMVIQAGKETLNWDDDRWEQTVEWMFKDVTLETSVQSGTEVVLLTVRDLHSQTSPSPLPQVWYTGPLLSESGDDAVVGFTIRLVMGADSDLLSAGQKDVAEVNWVMLGIPV